MRDFVGEVENLDRFIVMARLFRLLTREEFEQLSVQEMVAYRRVLAAHLREHIDDTHRWIAAPSDSSPKSGKA